MKVIRLDTQNTEDLDPLVAIPLLNLGQAIEPQPEATKLINEVNRFMRVIKQSYKQ
jgi:hypothetical protein